MDTNFLEAIKILNKSNLHYWICHGTLLGFVRSRSLIKWDNDIDIGLWESKSNRIKILEIFKQSGFNKKKKFFDKDNILTFTKGKNREVDINFYELTKDKKYCYQKHYVLKNLATRIIYVLSVSDTYTGKYKILINKLYFLKKFFIFLKKKLIKYNSFYTPAGFITPSIFFKRITIMNINSINIKIPFYYKEYLEAIYGKGWRHPIKKYDWEKNPNSTKLF
jgi:hypothetical protein